MVNTKSKGFSKVIILVIVLLVPGFLYVMINKIGSQNSYVKLPYYGDKVLTGEMKKKWGRETPDTLFHTLDSVQFIDQRGQAVTFLGKDSTISVVHLFYSKDPGLSKTMLDKLSTIAQSFAGHKLVKLYSISLDPADTGSVLADFAAPYVSKAPDNWFFLSQPSVDIQRYAQQSLLIDAMVNPADTTQYIFSNNFILIDTDRHIRGFYDVAQILQMERLEDEIKLQMVEEIRNRPLKVNQK